MTTSAEPTRPATILSDDLDQSNLMLCPICSETSGTHIDTVLVAARREDGLFTNVQVDAFSGNLSHVDDVPQGSTVGEGRRHRIAIGGWCELCNGKFSLVFTQHKGNTLVEWAIG